MRAEYASITADLRVEVSNFIRMEYLRGFAGNLIELYFSIKDSDSVQDALAEWTQKVCQERKMKVALMSTPLWLASQEDGESKIKSMRRLGEYVIRCVSDFDQILRSRIVDRLKCELGQLSFASQPFSEGALLDFYGELDRIQSGSPDCELCTFRKYHRNRLNRAGVDLYGETPRRVYKAFDGYVRQADALAAMETKDPAEAKGLWCRKLGDSIIAVHAPQAAVLVTVDRSFTPFGAILDLTVGTLRSMAQLKKEISATTSLEITLAERRAVARSAASDDGGEEQTV